MSTNHKDIDTNVLFLIYTASVLETVLSFIRTPDFFLNNNQLSNSKTRHNDIFYDYVGHRLDIFYLLRAARVLNMMFPHLNSFTFWLVTSILAFLLLSSTAGVVNFIVIMRDPAYMLLLFWVLAVLFLFYLFVIERIITFLADRNFDAMLFGAKSDGDLELSQHLFWFFSYYVLFLFIYGTVCYERTATRNADKKFSAALLLNIVFLLSIISVLITSFEPKRLFSSFETGQNPTGNNGWSISSIIRTISVIMTGRNYSPIGWNNDDPDEVSDWFIKLYDETKRTLPWYNLTPKELYIVGVEHVKADITMCTILLRHARKSYMKTINIFFHLALKYSSGPILLSSIREAQSQFLELSKDSAGHYNPYYCSLIQTTALFILKSWTQEHKKSSLIKILKKFDSYESEFSDLSTMLEVAHTVLNHLREDEYKFLTILQIKIDEEKKSQENQ